MGNGINTRIYDCGNISSKLDSNEKNKNQVILSPSLENKSLYDLKDNDIIYNDEYFNIERIKSKIVKNRDETYLNIIYLLDTTYSMKKNRHIIDWIKDINEGLKLEYKNIQFGFVLYKDFICPPSHLILNQDHIKVYSPSKKSFIDENIIYNGGYDYAEDWANSFYEISQLKLDKNYQNIVIHFCDSGAHGKKFSDYCYINSQEELLKKALEYCAEKKIKIIGLLFNQFSQKSFISCAKLYKGYYNLVDLTYTEINYLTFYKTISDNIKNAKENKKFFTSLDDYSEIVGFEDDFDWDEYKCKMMELKNIKNKYYNSNYYYFLPIINGRQVKEINEFLGYAPTPVLENGNYNNKECLIKTGIKQGHIGDCYLISSMISILYSKIPLTEYIFPEVDYDQNSKKIEMFLYENGSRKIITFKNTYAAYKENSKDDNKFIFSSPLNNAFFGMSIEKGYAINKSNKKNIVTGFKKIKGGQEYNVFNSLFGATSEYYHKMDMIPEKDLKHKIKKYLDFNGLVTFGVYFNIEGEHAFSVIGYKEDYNREFYVEILNPWHSGEYLENNIFKKSEFFKLSSDARRKFIDEKKGKNIYEREFKESQELYNIFNNYGKTGFLTLKMNIFYKWIGDICFSDPMLGYLETIIEIEKMEKNNYIINNKIYFKIKEKTKFRAFLLKSNEKLSELKKKMELFQGIANLNAVKYYIYLEKDEVNNYQINKVKDFSKLIYEILDPGNYLLEIGPDEIKENLYLKIQANNIIIYDKSRKDSLNNSIFSRKNCNCLVLGYDDCYFCQIYFSYQLINKIVESLMKLINYYNDHIFDLNNNNNYYYETFNDLSPDIIQSYKYISYSHLYFHYMSTKNGFIVLIINKYNFNWESKSRIEYNKYDQQFNAYFEFGSFKITKTLVIYKYENTKFQKILQSLDYYESTFSLLEVESFLSRRNEKIKYQQKLIQLNSEVIKYQKNIEQLKYQQILEQKKLDEVKLSIFSETKNLEKIKSEYILENIYLEKLKESIYSGKKNLEQINYQQFSEQKNLEKIKSECFLENLNLEKLKESIYSGKKNLEQINYQQFSELKNLEKIKSEYIIENHNLEKLKESIYSGKKNLDQINNQKISETKNLEKIKSEYIQENRNLDKLKESINSGKKNLEQIKCQKISEQKSLDKIKQSINTEKLNLEQLKVSKNSEQKKLDEIIKSKYSERQNLDQLKLLLNSERQNLEQLKESFNSEQKKLDEIKHQVTIKQEFLRTFRENNGKYDIVYMIDTTGSMRSWIEAVSEKCINITKELDSKFPKLNFKFGGIFYRDPIDCKEDKHEVFDLTNDISEFKNKIKKLKAGGGGDTPEDWVGAYEKAVNSIRWRDGTKLIIHITDAPAHTKEFCGKENHEKEIGKLPNVLKKCADNHIRIIGLPIEEDAKKSFEVCEKYYKKYYGSYKIFNYDKTDKETITEYFKNFVLEATEYIIEQNKKILEYNFKKS